MAALCGLLILALAQAATGTFGVVMVLALLGAFPDADFSPEWAGWLIALALLVSAFGSAPVDRLLEKVRP